jgi:hypothetical protein
VNRILGLAVFPVLALVGFAPARAQADPVDQAVAALRSSAVYVGADAPTIDRAKLAGSQLDRMKVAILPSGGSDPVSAARAIGAQLDPNRAGLTVVVFEGHGYGAASTAVCDAGSLINQAVDRNRSSLQSTDDVTSTVQDFVAAVRAAPSAAHGCGESTGSNAAAPSDSSTKSGSHTGLIVVLVLLGLLLAAAAWFFVSRRRRARREVADARAEVMPYYERLANEVATLDPGNHAEARQSLADAAERLGSARGQLASANSVAGYAAVGRTVVEGLHAARAARNALGLPPGPPLPPVTQARGDQLERPQEINVQGRTYQGYPSYTPGAPYYFAGGPGIPGGWYAFPFWEGLLIGDMLGGGLGWGWGGGWGGYDAGYDTGYDVGYNAGQDADDGSAGSGWGDSGGGGNWGDVGAADGGWGDSGGGGDWGGGDFGDGAGTGDATSPVGAIDRRPGYASLSRREGCA